MYKTKIYSLVVIIWVKNLCWGLNEFEALEMTLVLGANIWGSIDVNTVEGDGAGAILGSLFAFGWFEGEYGPLELPPELWDLLLGDWKSYRKINIWKWIINIFVIYELP